MTRILSFAIVAPCILFTGCESTALNQDNPTELSFQGTLSPRFYTCLGDDVNSYDVEVTFVTADDVNDDQGHSEDRNVEFYTDCSDLKLETWSFQSNFRFTLELSRFDGQDGQETHDCLVNLTFFNHYGRFEVSDYLTLFACPVAGSGS